VPEGADALECDVRLTADCHLVCVHDRRVDRTSNGRGPVSTLELATLQGLDFGSWDQAHGTDPEIPEVDRERDMLLTLRHLIDTVLNCGREVGLAIETKHPTRYAGQVERELASVLGEFGLDGAHVPGRPHVCVMSTAQVALARMQYSLPRLARSYTALSRQRGGARGNRGGGEMQLEVDRRRLGPQAWLLDYEQFGVVYQDARPGPRSGYSRIGWHTDHQSGPHLDVWPGLAFTIHFDPTSPANGFLRVLPGSHRGGTDGIPRGFERVPGEIGVYQERGDVLFHDADLWHSAARATAEGEAAMRRHLRGSWHGGTRLDVGHGTDDFVKNAAR